LAPLPPARVYHAVSTGYAGLCLARAKLETGRPAVVTEHGIYTNERCIEIAMADWLHEDKSFPSMTVHKKHRDLQDMWMHSFQSYSRACYEACDQIITLYGGNQSPQLLHGATSDRMRIIPNGIDYESFSSIPRINKKETTSETLKVALIGRVVPIKDVKTYIRAFAQVHKILPQAHGYMLGPYDEDLEYYEECKELVEYLGLESCFTFTGSVSLMEWLGRIDLIVLTSNSEAQPLVILEAGAAGVPCVATDVGACREMIEGDSRETPSLGRGGVVVPLSSPSLVA
jgi:glycosyltransferase involved in cell wall biosynthesis